MPGKCKFQDLWLEDEHWKKWLRVGSDKYSAFCCFCKKTFDISHSGINCIKSHAKGKKHSSFEGNVKSGRQMTISSFTSQPVVSELRPPSGNISSSCVTPLASCSRPSGSNNKSAEYFVHNETAPPKVGLSSFLLQDSVIKAEILWSSYCVLTNTSTRSGALASDIFPLMFPDSSIASKLQLHKDKISYSVTYGLGPYCSNLVATSARKSQFFALSVDECLNDICQKQQMDFMINYWDMDEDIVKTKYLTSAFLQRSTAVDLLDKVTHCIAESNLSLDKLLHLATDGPNVNLKLIFDLKSHMRESLESRREILDLGTCSLHVVNGAYKPAHNQTGWKLNQFMRSLYRLFKNYPSRRAVYCQITGCKTFPKKFCAVRWTENSSVIRRCLELLPHLKTYVQSIKDPPASDNFTTVKAFLCDDKTLEAKLHFSAMISEELEEFLILFQKNSPLLPFLHQEVFSLMKSLGSKFIKKKLLSSATTSSKLIKIDLDNFDNIQPLDSIDIGFGARSSLKNVKEIDAQRFKLDCKKFLMELYKKLMGKSPLNRKAVVGASCINPAVMMNENLRISRIKTAIEAFVSCSQISPADGDIIQREYNKFCEYPSVQQKLGNFRWKKDRLDSFLVSLWNEAKLELNYKFKNFVQCILICFHGNAAVERSFSFNKNFLVENMQEKSLVAQRALHDYIISLPGGLQSLQVSKAMILEFKNASARRKEDIKNKKEAEDKATSERKRAAQEMKDLKLKKQKLLEEKGEQLSEIDKKLKELERKSV